MEKENLSAITIDELKQKIKLQKVTMILFLVSMIIMLIAGIILTIRTGKFTPFIILPVTFLPLFIISFASRKKYLAELNRREG